MIDANTLTKIWDEHADRLLLIARSIGGPAEDAVQEGFVALTCQNELPDDPMGWLVRVVRNRLLQWQRSNRRRRVRETTASEVCWFDPETFTMDQRLDGCEVTAALMKLPSPAREIIVMHLWGEMTFESIAEVVGLSRATAHREFHRGLDRLKQQFNPESKFHSMRLCHEQ